MRTNPFSTIPNIGALLPQGLLYSRDMSLAETLRAELRLVLGITLVTDSLQAVLHTLGESDIQTLFIHLPQGSSPQEMDFVAQLRRTRPALELYLILDRKDPDLLLQGLRLGVRDCIVPTTGETTPFLQAVQRSLNREHEAGYNGFLYGCFSFKGGQGVTTISVNLSERIQQITGGRVLLLDLNLYMGDVRTMLPQVSGFTPFDLIQNISRMDENLLFSSLYHHPSGFFVLPSAEEISDAERVHRDQITDMIKVLKRYFTHIVIDLPHDFSEQTLTAMECADRVLLLVEPGLISIKSAQNVLTFFRELKYGEEKIALVLNRCDRKGALRPEDVEMVLKQPTFATVANDWTACEQASGKGDPLATLHPRRRITRDLHRLAERLTAVTENRPKQEISNWLRHVCSKN